MRVFVTGATGAIGPHALRALVEAGHEVSAIARTPDKRGAVEANGATPVEVSLFDRVALADAISLCGPRERIAERLAAWEASPVTTLIVGSSDPAVLELMAELTA